jgi:hypothetical protein
MTLDHVDFFDDDAPLVGMNAEDFATLASVFTSNDLDEIILANMERAGNPILHD